MFTPLFSLYKYAKISFTVKNITFFSTMAAVLVKAISNQKLHPISYRVKGFATQVAHHFPIFAHIPIGF
jgi:hypothetical protein